MLNLHIFFSLCLSSGIIWRFIITYTQFIYSKSRSFTFRRQMLKYIACISWFIARRNLLRLRLCMPLFQIYLFNISYEWINFIYRRTTLDLVYTCPPLVLSTSFCPPFCVASCWCIRVYKIFFYFLPDVYLRYISFPANSPTITAGKPRAHFYWGTLRWQGLWWCLSMSSIFTCVTFFPSSNNFNFRPSRVCRRFATHPGLKRATIYGVGRIQVEIVINLLCKSI